MVSSSSVLAAGLATALALAGAVARAEAVTEPLAALERRAGELAARQAELLRRREEARRGLAAAEEAIAAARARLGNPEAAGERAALEASLARARELAVTLRLLDGQAKRLDDDAAALTRQRLATLEQLIDREQRELARDAATLDSGALRERLRRAAELRRRRDGLAATLPAASAHRGGDLAGIVAGSGESADALAEKADLVASFARGWRQERDQAQRWLTQNQEELDFVHRLTGVMEARRRGRLGSSDPFAADVEAFALRERERQLLAVMATLERRLRELSGWIEDADRRRAELLQASAKPEQP